MTVRIDPTAIKTAINAPHAKFRKSAIYTGAVSSTAIPSWPFLEADGVTWGVTTDSGHATKHLIGEPTFNLLRDGTILPNFVVRSLNNVTFRIDSVPNGLGVLYALAVSDGNSDAMPEQSEKRDR